jgi:alpha-tubulin suppressor-like RCC1 family protein
MRRPLGWLGSASCCGFAALVTTVSCGGSSNDTGHDTVSDDGGASGDDTGADAGDVSTIPADGGQGAVSLSAGDEAACVITNGGALKCWGAGASSPVTLEAGSTFLGASLGGVAAASLFGIRSDGALLTWAPLSPSATSPSPTTTQLSGVVFRSVSAGGFHQCATTTTGALYCWGGNEFGQLGDGTMTRRSAPTQVGSAQSWRVVSAGGVHTCAIQNDGALFCWGSGAFGQLGNGSDAGTTSASSRVGSDAWTDVSAGANSTCAVRADGSLLCWGSDSKTGNPLAASSVPTPVDSATDWARVRIASTHGCAIKTTGTLHCWGANTFGEVGTGSIGAKAVAPTQVGADADWVDVAVGTGFFSTSFSCGTKKDGSVLCWGSAADGHLGDGTPAPHATPEKIGAAGEWLHVAALGGVGMSTTCGVKKTSAVYTWGAPIGSETAMTQLPAPAPADVTCAIAFTDTGYVRRIPHPLPASLSDGELHPDAAQLSFFPGAEQLSFA